MRPSEVYIHAARLAFKAGLITLGEIQAMTATKPNGVKSTQYFRVKERLTEETEENNLKDWV